MIVKHLSDQIVVETSTCGEVREILKKGDYGSFGVAICIDIKPTQAHYHRTFDETYFVLDGELKLGIFDPATKNTVFHTLKANELCVITKGLHHKVMESTEHNRLCVISSPPFHADDETPSDKM